MERKIGETIEFDDTELKVVEITKEERQANESCVGCYFFHEDTKECSEFKDDAYAERQLGSCYENKRTDKKSVKFMKVRREAMKKISYWEDLIGIQLTTTRGLSAKVTDEDDCYTANIYHGNEIEPIIVIDWAFDLERMVNAMYTLGFDLEYKAPFDLFEFLRENLCKKTFKVNEANYYFMVDNYDDTIELNLSLDVKIIGALYLKSKVTHIIAIVERKFEEEKVTKIQLIDALEELGWM